MRRPLLATLGGGRIRGLGGWRWTDASVFQVSRPRVKVGDTLLLVQASVNLFGPLVTPSGWTPVVESNLLGPVVDGAYGRQIGIYRRTVTDTEPLVHTVTNPGHTVGAAIIGVEPVTYRGSVEAAGYTVDSAAELPFSDVAAVAGDRLLAVGVLRTAPTPTPPTGVVDPFGWTTLLEQRIGTGLLLRWGDAAQNYDYADATLWIGQATASTTGSTGPAAVGFASPASAPKRDYQALTVAFQGA